MNNANYNNYYKMVRTIETVINVSDKKIKISNNINNLYFLSKDDDQMDT